MKPAALLSRAVDIAKYRPNQRLYIACSEIDFSWYEWEVTRIIRLWNDGMAIWDIAEEMKRPEKDVFGLLWDLAENNRIKERPGGIFGKDETKTRLLQDTF